MVFHGVAYAGGIVTTINPTYVEREVHHQLVDADARLLVTVAPFLEVARAAAEGTAVEEIFVIGEADRRRPAAHRPDGRAARRSRCPSTSDDTVVLPYSSGTTGVSKGVMLTHRNLVANVAQMLGAARPARRRDDHRRAAVLPHLRHAGADELRAARGRHDRHAAALRPRAVPRGSTRSTASRGPSSRRRSWSRWPSTRSSTTTTCRSSSRSSPARRRCRPSWPSRPVQRLGCEVVQGYGMTELSPVSHITPAGQFKPGSVGVTAPNTEMRIVDPSTGERPRRRRRRRDLGARARR